MKLLLSHRIKLPLKQLIRRKVYALIWATIQTAIPPNHTCILELTDRINCFYHFSRECLQTNSTNTVKNINMYSLDCLHKEYYAVWPYFEAEKGGCLYAYISCNRLYPIVFVYPVLFSHALYCNYCIVCFLMHCIGFLCIVLESFVLHCFHMPLL